jgi:FkbM family methyltransferase
MKESAIMWRHDLFSRYMRAGHHPMKTRLSKLLRTTLMLEDVFIKTDSGVNMCLNPDDLVQFEILNNGCYEHETLDLICRLLRNGGCFLDIGGHVGQYSLEVARTVGERARIAVVEPNPKTFSYLLRNIALNNFMNIQPVLGVASDQEGFVAMQLPPPDNWGLSREVTQREGFTYTAMAFRLDNFLSNAGIKTVDVVKIDVEGSELKVLKGMLSSGQYAPHHIVFEFVPTHFGEADDAVNYLIGMNYELFNVLGEPFVRGTNDTVPDGNVWAKKIK